MTGCDPLFGESATAAALADALATHHPSLIVSTSHGMTGPLSNPAAMIDSLGLLVGVDGKLVSPLSLLEKWSPEGAVWYTHACCSAGSDSASRYAGLFDAGSDLERLLSGIAGTCGDRIAPLPLALLGAKKPLRAFIGHVEPTFDWTLRDPDTRQVLSHAIVRALFDRIFAQGAGRMTLGQALEEIYDEVGGFLAAHAQAVAAVNSEQPQAREKALYRQLVAMDRQQMVILGDPTVMLPPLPSV
jgi:hypothetical protein